MQLAFLKGRADYSLLSDKLVLRLPKKTHFAQFSKLRSESYSFLKPFVPKGIERKLSRTGFAKRVKTCADAAKKRTEFAFLVFVISESEPGEKVETLVGGITLSNIRFGAARHANVGYWLGENHTGHNYMGDAMSLCLEFAFNTLHLQRIHAACMPHNQPSINVLTKSGFVQEGFAEKYLQIDGTYRDHQLYGLTVNRYASIKGN